MTMRTPNKSQRTAARIAIKRAACHIASPRLDLGLQSPHDKSLPIRGRFSNVFYFILICHAFTLFCVFVPLGWICEYTFLNYLHIPEWQSCFHMWYVGMYYAFVETSVNLEPELLKPPYQLHNTPVST